MSNPGTTLAAEDIAHWREWIGRSEVRSEMLDLEGARRFAAAIGENLDVERQAPSLMHWAFFLPVASADQIGDDGHPKRGGFLPPISLPRRMFAASDMQFPAALKPGRVAQMTSIIADVKHRSGRAGELIFVEVERQIEQDGKVCVRERQSIVYRDMGAAQPPVEELPLASDASSVIWRPGTVDLFRFSAVTFNSHRIHYDLPYTQATEGYPGLVVHGPFTAVKLFGHARAIAGREPSAFSFRAAAPLFVSQPVRLSAGESPGQVQAIRCDGTVAVTATAAF